MTGPAIENIRIDPDIGDGIAFTVDTNGTAHRFFVSRLTLGELERTLLVENHDMLASFERQSDKIRNAVLKVLKFGVSHNVTFLTLAFFH